MSLPKNFRMGLINFGSDIVQDDVAQEKEIIEAETEQNKEVFGKIVTEETLQHSIETLQHTEVKEANILPDKYDLLKERIEDNLAQDVQSFDTASLKTVTTYESSGIEMFKVDFFFQLAQIILAKITF